MLGEASAGYDLGKTLLEAGLRRYRKYSTLRADRLLQDAQKGYENRWLADYLRWKYPEASLLSAAGHIYPIAVYPSSAEQLKHPELALARPLNRRGPSDDDLLGSASYRALAHRVGLKMYDRPCYVMSRLRTDGGPQIDCELGSYLRALDTCDELAWELLANHSELRGDDRWDFQRFDAYLPLRSEVHRTVVAPNLIGLHRCAAVAVSAMIAFEDEGRVVLLVKRRSARAVAVHTGMVHVVPSFMLQPATADLESEYSVTHNFFREYLEELFDRPEPEVHEGDWQYFYDDPRLLYLRRLLDGDGAELYFTGIAVNLLTLRPEICLLLRVTDPEWYTYHRRNQDPSLRFRFNDEWMRVMEMSARPGDAIARIAYTRQDVDLLPAAALKPTELVPPGAAALWLAKWLLDEIA